MLRTLKRRIRPMAMRRRPLAQAPAIDGSSFIFVCGLHRSGTTLLHDLLRHCPAVGALTGTGVPRDEGQHVQSVFTPALAHGGPGRFAFDPVARMTEASAKDLSRERDTLLREWGAYLDLDKRRFLEKSPPNLIRTRYLQALFPGASFIFIVRHPIPTTLATKKWEKSAHLTHLELMLHWHVAHALMLRDVPFLERAITIRYEDLVADPDACLRDLIGFLDLDEFQNRETVTDQNAAYLRKWETGRVVDDDLLREMMARPGSPLRRFGYSLEPPYEVADPASNLPPLAGADAS